MLADPWVKNLGPPKKQQKKKLPDEYLIGVKAGWKTWDRYSYRCETPSGVEPHGLFPGTYVTCAQNHFVRDEIQRYLHNATSLMKVKPPLETDFTSKSSIPDLDETLLIITCLPCIAMYHCDITWITPEQPSEIQQKLEHGPQFLHQQRQSREQEAVSADTRTHSHRPAQHQQQHKQHNHQLSFVNLLVSDSRGQELKVTRLPFVRDFLASHHRDGNHITSEHTNGQLRSISLSGVLTPHQQSLLSPLPTASSVSQFSQVGTSSATPTRPCVSSSRRPFG